MQTITEQIGLNSILLQLLIDNYINIIISVWHITLEFIQKITTNLKNISNYKLFKDE